MNTFKEHKAFLIPYFIFLLTLAALIFSNEKAELHLTLNSFRHVSADYFFRYYTHVGEWVPFLVAVGLLFFNYRNALIFSLAEICSSILTRVIKKNLAVARPKTFFAENFPELELPTVAGVELHAAYSFPSGHTTAGFALFFSLALFTKSKNLQFIYFILAALVGYSRIYLSQHFANDVFAGSLVGVLTTLLVYYIVNLWSPDWYNKSLLKRDRPSRESL